MKLAEFLDICTIGRKDRDDTSCCILISGSGELKEATITLIDISKAGNRSFACIVARADTSAS